MEKISIGEARRKLRQVSKYAPESISQVEMGKCTQYLGSSMQMYFTMEEECYRMVASKFLQ